MIDAEVQERLWRKVVKTSYCWNWTGKCTDGYGSLSIKNKKYYTHRISWIIHFGEIPDGICVLHRCDNRKCMRPDHLFLGTRRDNYDDMVAKGRRVYTVGKEVVHGTAAGYKHHKCRCQLCKEVFNRRRREVYKLKKDSQRVQYEPDPVEKI